MTADEIWLLARYDYQRDIRAWTILATTWCLIPVISPSLRYWQPARYDCYRYLGDIARYEILLLATYCSLAPCEILLPARNGYLRDIASNAIWLLVRYACLQNINYTRMPFQVIGNIDSQRNMTAYGYQLPIQLYCQIGGYTEILLLVEYCCQRHNSEILVPLDIRCGGANDGRTPILGCTQEPRRKAAYCIDVVMCVREKRREKVGGSRIVGGGRIGGGISCRRRIIVLNGT